MKQSIASLEAQVKAWNDANAIGCEVDVTRDDGRVEHTRTRSAAWVLSGHTAVIMVEGISGAYLLERVKRRAPRQEDQRPRQSDDDSSFIANMAGAIPALDITTSPAEPAVSSSSDSSSSSGGGEW